MGKNKFYGFSETVPLTYKVKSTKTPAVTKVLSFPFYSKRSK